MIKLKIVPGLRRDEELELYEGVWIDNRDGTLSVTIDGRRFMVTSDFVQDSDSLEGFIEAVRQVII